MVDYRNKDGHLIFCRWANFVGPTTLCDIPWHSTLCLGQRCEMYDCHEHELEGWRATWQIEEEWDVLSSGDGWDPYEEE